MRKNDKITTEIITIGDELLIGQVVDTNSTWIASRLEAAGFTVARKTTVSDDPQAIVCALEGAATMQLVVMTGGLGPTRDDKTKQVLAEYFRCAMRFDEPTARHIKKMLAARGISFNELNRSQAMVPEGCILLHNDWGTAPGMLFEQGSRMVISLPGVPYEMMNLFQERVLPLLHEKFHGCSHTHMTVLTYGIPESELAECIAPWEDDLPRWLRLAYLPGPGGIRLRLSATEDAPEDSLAIAVKEFTELRTLLGHNFVTDSDISFEAVVADLLKKRKATLAVAESCTGGAMAALLTRAEGASEFFLGGVVSYSNSLKTGILGVRQEDIDRYGAVSEQVALQMAEGVRHLTGADHALATTGIAGPGGGTELKPVGTVWIAVAGPGGSRAQLFNFGKLRDQNIKRTVYNALNILRITLIDREH